MDQRELKRSLESEELPQRCRGYKRLREALGSMSEDEFWEEYGSALFKGTQSSSESIREVCLEILLQLSHMGEESDWAYFYAGLNNHQEESCEEIRLLRVSLLHQLAQRKSLYTTFSEQYFTALPSLLMDPFPDIRVKALSLLRLLSPLEKPHRLREALPHLLPPLSSNLTHVRNGVREAALHAFPELLIASGNCENEFGDLDVSLAQRCFDPSPKVRKALSQVSANLLQNWPHNQKHHLRILLILLSQYEDEYQEVREVTESLWREHAEAWIKKEIKCSSNGEDLKDKMDFPRSLDHYPSEVQRPSFPCREYLSRHFHRILPATWMDLKDWRVETRVKASQLLYVCFLHMEDRLTEHSVEILKTIEHGAKDNEPEVILNLEKAAKYFGYFVDPKVWSPIFIERAAFLGGDDASNLLRILSFIISGSERRLLSLVLVELGDALSKDAICMTIKSEQLKSLLDCIHELIRVSGKSISIIQHQAFKTLLVSVALSGNNEIKERGRNLLKELAQGLELPNGLRELFALESGAILEAYSISCSEWIDSSPESFVFGTLLNEPESCLWNHVDVIFQIIQVTLDPGRGKLCELRLRIFMMLSRQISFAVTQGSDPLLQNYSFKLINDIICPALKWSSGKKATAIRTAASCTLLSILECRSLSSTDLSSLVSSDLFPRMNSLLEDDSRKTRLFIMKAYTQVFALGRQNALFQAHQVIKILSFIVERLNDESNEVRMEALRAIREADGCLDPKITDSTYNKELEKLYESIVLHMDDESNELRKGVCELLHGLSTRDPLLMCSVVKNAQSRHQYKEECSTLLQSIEKLSI